MDFKDVDFNTTEQDVLERELSAWGLYGEEFAYSAFHPSLTKMVLKTGSFHDPKSNELDDIDCCILNPPLSEKRGIRDDDEDDLVSYMISAESEGKGAFAVYDRNQLEERPLPGALEGSHPWYRFKHPDRKLDALLAIVKVDLT